MAQKSQKEVRDALMQQLRAKGADAAHFESLVDDYMAYFGMVRKLRADIRRRGLTYTSVSSTGKEYEKDNPSVKLLPTYTQAMLRILRELGLTTDEPVDDGTDEL